MYNPRLSRREFLKVIAAAGAGVVVAHHLGQRIGGSGVALAAPNSINPDQKPENDVDGLAQLLEYATKELEELVLKADDHTKFYWRVWNRGIRTRKENPLEQELDRRWDLSQGTAPSRKLLVHYDKDQDRILEAVAMYDMKKGNPSDHVKGKQIPLILLLYEGFNVGAKGTRTLVVADVGFKGKLVLDQGKRLEESDTFSLYPVNPSGVRTKVKWAGDGSFVVEQYPAMGFFYRRASFDAAHRPESYQESGSYSLISKLGHDSARGIASDAYTSVINQQRNLVRETIERLTKDGKIVVKK